MVEEIPGGFTCAVCGQHHAVLPLAYGSLFPEAAGAIPKDEIDRRVVITKDLCVLDDRFYYVRGRFVLPVHGDTRPFIWGCWARVSAHDFFRTQQRWNDPDRVDDPPFDGLLNNTLPVYGNTLNLPVRVVTQTIGRRPSFLVADPQHPLALELQHGISVDRVIEIASRMTHLQAATNV